MQRFQEMEGQLQASANVVSGTVRVATVHSVGLYELSASLKRYLKAFPQVHLRLEYSRSSKIYDDAVRGHIDLGIVAFPTRRPGITVIPFRQDRLVLVTPPGHPLARHRTVAVRKLAGEPLVGFERDIPTRKETDRLLRKHGVEVRYVMELDNVETIKQVVEIGHGVAILPEPAIRPEVKQKSLAVVQLSDEVLFRPLGIIHRQGKHFSPAAEKFIEFCEQNERVAAGGGSPGGGGGGGWLRPHACVERRAGHALGVRPPAERAAGPRRDAVRGRLLLLPAAERRIGSHRLAPPGSVQRRRRPRRALLPGHAHERRDFRDERATTICASISRRRAFASGASTTGRTRSPRTPVHSSSRRSPPGRATRSSRTRSGRPPSSAASTRGRSSSPASATEPGSPTASSRAAASRSTD